MRDLILKRLPEVWNSNSSRSIILPNGDRGRLSISTTRRGKEGGLSYCSCETAAGIINWLVVMTPSGQENLPLTLPDGWSGDPIEAALADDKIAQRVIQFFPTAQAEYLGSKGKRPSISGL